MKISKSLLNAMLVAITAGAIISCQKPKVDDGKKTAAEKTEKGSAPVGCPACGMG